MATCQPFREGKQKQQEQHLHHGGCALPSVHRGTVLLPWQDSLAPPPTAPELSSSSGRSATEEMALKIHSEAERRRRERINAHLATLRGMIPDAKQMDKATLLARVVKQVKDLKRTATEVTQAMPIPPEANEVTVQCYTGQSHAAVGDDRTTYIRASVSCDDRPNLLADIARAFHGLRLRALRADMTSLGGRTHHIFILCSEEANLSVCLKSLKEAVRQALANVAFPEMVYSSSSRIKRQRVLDSHYSVMYSL